MTKSTVTWVVSPFEQNLLREERPEARVEIVANIVDVKGRQGDFESRRDIVFIGGFDHPPKRTEISCPAKTQSPKILLKSRIKTGKPSPPMARC